MSDYRTLENKIRDIVARPWTKDPKQVHHKQQQIQKKIIDEAPDMLSNKNLGIPDSVIEAAKTINKKTTEVEINPDYKTKVDQEEELVGKQHKIDANKNGKIDADDFKKLKAKTLKEAPPTSSDPDQNAPRYPGSPGYDNEIKFKPEPKKPEQKKPAVPPLPPKRPSNLNAEGYSGTPKDTRIVFTGSPSHTSKKAKQYKARGYEIEKLKKGPSGIFGDSSEKHTYLMVHKSVKEEIEQVDEISHDLARRVIRKAAAEKSIGYPKKDRTNVLAMAGKKAYPETVGKPRVPATTEEAKPDYLDFDKDGNEAESMKKALKDKKKVTKEEVVFSDEEIARLEGISKGMNEALPLAGIIGGVRGALANFGSSARNMLGKPQSFPPSQSTDMFQRQKDMLNKGLPGDALSKMKDRATNFIDRVKDGKYNNAAFGLQGVHDVAALATGKDPYTQAMKEPQAEVPQADDPGAPETPKAANTEKKKINAKEEAVFSDEEIAKLEDIAEKEQIDEFLGAAAKFVGGAAKGSARAKSAPAPRPTPKTDPIPGAPPKPANDPGAPTPKPANDPGTLPSPKPAPTQPKPSEPAPKGPEPAPKGPEPAPTAPPSPKPTAPVPGKPNPKPGKPGPKIRPGQPKPGQKPDLKPNPWKTPDTLPQELPEPKTEVQPKTQPETQPQTKTQPQPEPQTKAEPQTKTEVQPKTNVPPMIVPPMPMPVPIIPPVMKPQAQCKTCGPNIAYRTYERVEPRVGAPSPTQVQNSYEPTGNEIIEANLAAQIRDAKPSLTGHIEVSVGDKKVKIAHRKAQDFLGSYHSKRTPAEKDAHEKAFRREIGG